MTVLFVFVQILSLTGIAFGLLSLYNCNRKIIKHSIDLQKFIREDLIRMHLTVGLLETQCPNPIVFECFEQLRKLKYDELPKNDREFLLLCQAATKKVYQKMWESLNDALEKAETIDEKILCQKRLDKMSTVMDILESISEDSSNDYLKQVTREIFHLISENEEI
jgi:hypothetical protein